MKTDHVGQHERKHGGIGGDGRPGDSLTVSAGGPGGILGRVDDGGSPGVGREKEECGEHGEGTHDVGWMVGVGERRRWDGDGEGNVQVLSAIGQKQTPVGWAGAGQTNCTVMRPRIRFLGVPPVRIMCLPCSRPGKTRGIYF